MYCNLSPISLCTYCADKHRQFIIICMGSCRKHHRSQILQPSELGLLAVNEADIVDTTFRKHIYASSITGIVCVKWKSCAKKFVFTFFAKLHNIPSIHAGVPILSGATRATHSFVPCVCVIIVCRKSDPNMPYDGSHTKSQHVSPVLCGETLKVERGHCHKT